jgi:signal transduction histidine kinase
VGQQIRFIYLPEEIQAGVPEQEMRRAQETGRATDERWHLGKDGHRVFVSGVMAPLTVDEQLIGYTKIARDLTQRERYEEEMRHIQERLEVRVRERTGELANANEELRRQYEQRAHAEQSRLELLRHVVQAQEDERRRISRELHDQLGQEMTALRLKLSALRSSDAIGAAARPQIESVEELVRQLDTDLEFLVRKLRPTGLDDNGLAETLRTYVESWSSTFGVPATVEVTIDERIPLEVETVLYRIAQEALTNVAKHARAGRVELRLDRDGDFYQMVIADDGIGFDTTPPMGHRSLGLLSMRERAVLVNGLATIESRRGAGTTVRVRIPA